ncbi:Alpha-2Db adrenergic receptor [Exaiptasia diaphana]|nr:Alpha-2Db adrenergic receptor [Exaiptasia diaphana]
MKLGISCIVTVRRLSRRQAIEAHMSEDQQKMRAQRTRAAVRMVVVSALLYILCWLPSFFLKSAHAFRNKRGSKIIPYAYRADPSCGLFFIIFPLTFLPIVNSCFSPFIYIIFLRDFREAAKKVLCSGKTLNQIQNRTASNEPPQMQGQLTGL